jgi:hypothetical protein
VTRQHQHDRSLVRDLAQQVAELAASPEMEARRQRWRDVNALRQPDRAPVWCRPAGVWKELLPPDALECEDALCRSVEYHLRQELIKDWIGDDHLIEPWWPVGAAFDRDTEHLWGLPVQQLVDSTDLGGWRYDPPLKTEEDFERVQIPTFTYNDEKTQRALSQMDDLLGDILPVRLVCGPPLGAHASVYADQLRGLSAMMLDMKLTPHLVHRLMAKFCEGALRGLRTVEETGLLTPNNYGGMFCSDPINDAPAEGPVRLHHLWAAANSQEFDEVSPAMWEEFCLHYQLPILQQFGLSQYGCCEDLTTKTAGVLRIPNLRVFVCSAWTDLDQVIEACGDTHCIMWRQSAAEVTLPDGLTHVREHLREGVSKLRGCAYQVVLREIETLPHGVERLREWARVGIEVAGAH